MRAQETARKRRAHEGGSGHIKATTVARRHERHERSRRRRRAHGRLATTERIKNLLWAVHARDVSDSYGLKNLLKQFDNDPAVSLKALTTSSEAAGNIRMLSVRDCPMGA
ncbi:hypothetical protein EVAR_71159_1 [Eumeta japonica]|uniref:Uncharacterized protein n=1 Tax=Eumeta variegata TaxID=151549 RepID=A0A4C1T2W1_EUMVA|nr:hypothetical protein EVAR_71159_1 [Eumeta japonica]